MCDGYLRTQRGRVVGADDVGRIAAQRKQQLRRCQETAITHRQLARAAIGQLHRGGGKGVFGRGDGHLVAAPVAQPLLRLKHEERAVPHHGDGDVPCRSWRWVGVEVAVTDLEAHFRLRRRQGQAYLHSKARLG